MLEQVKQAKIGSIVPVYKEINEEINALDYFAKLSDYGRKKNSMLFEYDGKSFGSANPCLVLMGKGIDFEIMALNNTGKRLLNFIKKDFGFCDKAVYRKDRIEGKLTPARKPVSEQERLKLKTHMDIIRAVAFKFRPTEKIFEPYCGLFGMISQDFAGQFEDFSSNEDSLKDPDYILYFLDNMFMIDHAKKKTYFVANALVTDNKRDKVYQECTRIINSYEKLIDKKTPKGRKPAKKELKVSYEPNKDEFISMMESMKRNILEGNILCASPSRKLAVNCNAESLDIYSQIKHEQDNCRFYINDKHGVLIDSGCKATLNSNGQEIEFKISTAEEPRGIIDEGIERNYDNKHELLLKVDDNEIAYNVMLVDSIRNEIAKISIPGTRYAEKLLVVDKKEKFQSLVSVVKGTLSEGMDALHSFDAAFTINGIPKTSAMQLLRKAEKSKRGLSSGFLVCISPDKSLQSMSIEPVRIKKDVAYARLSCRVYHNSDNENELKTLNNNETILLDTIRAAAGVK